MAVKYSINDKDMLVKILANYPIIEDKRTDAYNIEKKKRAWEKIANEYNLGTSEQRSVIQLKRLWDKMKRGRKSALAEERREMMATGGGPYKPPPPQPEIDTLAPHLDFEIEVEHDSDGLNLSTEVVQIPETSDNDRPGPSFAVVHDFEALNEPTTESALDATAAPTSAKGKTKQKSHLDNLTEARLNLIKKEEVQMEGLNRLRMEEAEYRKEAARLVMLQEQAKLKKIQGS